MSKLEEKKLAIQLRKEGSSYSEILKKISVSKSTLSTWLHSEKLSKRLTLINTQKRIEAAKRGSLKIKTNRLLREVIIKDKAITELGSVDKKSFLVIGSALYWAEGNKQKEGNVSSRVLFSNSDPEMILFFKKWLNIFCGVQNSEFVYELYIHKNADTDSVKLFWSNLLNIETQKIILRYKKGNFDSFRKNKYSNYKGLIRMTVLKSTDLNRKIMSWALECSKQFKTYSGIV